MEAYRGGSWLTKLLALLGDREHQAVMLPAGYKHKGQPGKSQCGTHRGQRGVRQPGAHTEPVLGALPSCKITGQQQDAQDISAMV